MEIWSDAEGGEEKLNKISHGCRKQSERGESSNTHVYSASSMKTNDVFNSCMIVCIAIFLYRPIFFTYCSYSRSTEEVSVVGLGGPIAHVVFFNTPTSQ